MAKSIALADNLAANNPGYFSGYDGSHVLFTGAPSRLTIAVPTLTSVYYQYSSVAGYDITNSSLSVAVPQTISGASAETQFTFIVDANNSLLFVKNGTSLTLRHRLAGSNNDTGVTYNATSMLYWRIRSTGTTINWETSPDGWTWTSRRSLTTSMTLTNGTMQCVAGCYNATTSNPGSAIFYNFNMPHPREFFVAI